MKEEKHQPACIACTSRDYGELGLLFLPVGSGGIGDTRQLCERDPQEQTSFGHDPETFEEA